MASWLTYPLQLTGSRDFVCDKFTEEQCSYYMQRWHFWCVCRHDHSHVSLTVWNQVHRRLRLRFTDSSFLHERPRHIHHRSPHIIPCSGISQVPRPTGMAQTDCSYSLPVISRVPCIRAALELGTYWTVASWGSWGNILLL